MSQSKPQRYYAQYWNDTPHVDQRGWRVYDRNLTYGTGDTMPIAQCWTRNVAFEIRDLLNAREESARNACKKYPNSICHNPQECSREGCGRDTGMPDASL